MCWSCGGSCRKRCTAHFDSDPEGRALQSKEGILHGALPESYGATPAALVRREQKTITLFYVRFMDDMLVLAPTRWKLKKAVKSLQLVNNTLWQPDRLSP